MTLDGLPRGHLAVATVVLNIGGQDNCECICGAPFSEGSTMDTLIILEMRVKEGSVAGLQAFLKQIFPDTRRFEGCQDINAYLGDDGRTIMLVQHWDSAASYQRYLTWRQETGVFAEIMAMLDGEPVMRFFSAIAA
jgi:quinol monooxygenase YgiN